MAIRDILRDNEEKMHKTVEATQREFATIRTGRASPALVEGIKVNYYNTPTPLVQLASIGTPDAKLIVVQPYDPSALGEIERAILSSNIGMTPVNDGRVIRLGLPDLSKERREELAKTIRKIAEEGRISIRTCRHHSIEQVRKLKADGLAAEDEVFKAQEDVQKATDKHIAKIDEILKQKEKEVLEL